MANGNGNNINTDDAAAAAAAAATTTAQEQQHLTGDGSGACGDVKLPASARGSNVNDLVADLWLNGSGSSSNRGDYTNIRATTGAAATASAATVTATATTSATLSSNVGSSTSTSTFSFKHFLNSSGTIIAPSSTVTSLDPAVGPSSNSAGGCSSSNTSVTAPATSTSLQTSTGARPKVPQSASVSHMQPDLNGSAASKMKRSPRFSSFDSQASLAEYAACGGGTGGSSGSGTRLRPDLRLEVERSGVMLDCDDDYDHVGLAQVRNSRLYDERADDDIFPSAASNLHASASSSRYVPRSYSSYDMPPQAACAAASPRRRAALRPNRLVLSSAAKMKLDLPLDASNVAGAASALPDFVQDHLPDAWCQEAHLSSPPNSPLGAAEAPSCSGAMGGGSLLLPAAVAAGLPSVSTLAATVGEAAGSTGKMLPDFLSDGPILHSSQRLADVAIGLPSNSIDSPPQEADAGTSTLRQENERLKRELQEIRVELNVQTRRAQEFEQQLLALADARRRETLAATAQTQTTQRLRRQVAQLEADLFELRGSSDQVSGGAAAAAAAGGASVMTPGSSHSSSSNTSRPSRTHQLSRDLLRAADNAEQNLRQLLAGVDNLRQMAASLEQPTAPAATPRSPNSDSYTDFN